MDCRLRMREPHVWLVETNLASVQEDQLVNCPSHNRQINNSLFRREHRSQNPNVHTRTRSAYRSLLAQKSHRMAGEVEPLYPASKRWSSVSDKWLWSAKQWITTREVHPPDDSNWLGSVVRCLRRKSVCAKGRIGRSKGKRGDWENKWGLTHPSD